MLMDEISTGLDSATTYSVAKFLSNTTHVMGLTTMIGLLQPPPEVYAIFDDVLLLTDGCVTVIALPCPALPCPAPPCPVMSSAVPQQSSILLIASESFEARIPQRSRVELCLALKGHHTGGSCHQC